MSSSCQDSATKKWRRRIFLHSVRRSPSLLRYMQIISLSQLMYKFTLALVANKLALANLLCEDSCAELMDLRSPIVVRRQLCWAGGEVQSLVANGLEFATFLCEDSCAGLMNKPSLHSPLAANGLEFARALHPRCKTVTSTRQKGDDPKTDQMTKGADSELPGWQPKEKVPLTATKRGALESASVASMPNGRGPKDPSVRRGIGPKDPGVAAPLVAAGCRGNCLYDMGGRSHASACSSPSSHSWTSPSRTFPSGPSVLLPYSGLMDESSVNGGTPWNERTIFGVDGRFHRLLGTFVQWHQILRVSR